MQVKFNKNLKELREDVFEVRQQMDAIHDAAERDNRAVTTAEQRKIADLQKRHADAEIELGQYMQSLESQSRGIASESLKEIRAAKIKAAQNDTTMGKLARHLIVGGPEPQELRAVTSSSGAAMINDPVVLNNLLYALQAEDPLVQAGAEFLVMENNSVFPKATGIPAGQWVGAEGTQVTDASMTVGSVKWDFVDLAILVKVQNQALMDSSGRAERLVTESIRRGLQDAILKAVLYGAAGSDQPDGLDNITGVQTVDAGSVPLGNYSYLLEAYRKLLDVNANPANFSMIGNPIAWHQLASIQDGNANPRQMPQGLEEMRKFWTTAVKKDYGVGENQNRLYVGDFSQLVIGFSSIFNFRLEELFADYLQTGFLMHVRVDVQALHANNFVRIENIDNTIIAQGN